jgi:hypothetical protein
LGRTRLPNTASSASLDVQAQLRAKITAGIDTRNVCERTGVAAANVIKA